MTANLKMVVSCNWTGNDTNRNVVFCPAKLILDNLENYQLVRTVTNHDWESNFGSHRCPEHPTDKYK